jgi:Tfp pilus assembly protein PilF
VTFQAMAQARTAKGDKQGATKDLEKAVELDPQNAQAKTLLAQVKAQ